MKAFHFALDPALRWRVTQLRLEQEATARISGQITTLQAQLYALHSELRSGGEELVRAGSVVFESWQAYTDRCRRLIRVADSQLIEEKKVLAAQTQKVVQAHQKVRMLENLRRVERADWTRGLNRETEAFADEAYLAKLLRDRRSNGSQLASR